ncbi:unnamed protein product, partial [Adineta steineri]
EQRLDQLIQSQINQFQLVTPNSLLNIFNLIRETIGANMIISVYGLLTVYGKCNCGTSWTCTQSSQGMMTGCYPLESLLQTTLQCFYNQSCIDSTNKFAQLNISSLKTSQYQVNTTIQLILNNLMIEEYIVNKSYEDYFNQCAPSSCSYNYMKNYQITEGIINIVGLYSGLAETTINTNTTTIDVLTTKKIILTTSTIETTMLTTSTNSHTTTKNISKFSKWKQNAITVAGRNEKGQELNQLDSPRGIFVGRNKNIFIADCFNHRIVEWKYNANEGQIIAGGNGYGNRADQLYNPTDMIVDQQNHSIIIADYGNRRVIHWMNQNQQILIHNSDCYALATDKYGFLYVSNWGKNEVRRWKMGEYNNEGIVVAGGNGQGDQFNQLKNPTFLFVDENQSVYVSDYHNNRVMKWRKGAKAGIIVAGGNGKGKNLNQLSCPQGLIVDDFGRIYVADFYNHRVMRWSEGKEEGEVIVGGNGEGNQSNQLNLPRDLSFDDEGNLYVTDYFNHRIQKFEI